MAKYSWDKAEQENYKTTLTALSRQTIADGDLLNENIEAFEGRDNYVNDSVDPLSNTLDETIEIIQENSAKNWNNELLTGFSAISADTSVMRMTKNNDGPVKLQFNAMSVEVDENNNIVLSIPSYYSSSYMLCASATLNPAGQQTIFSYDGSNMPNTVLGSDNILTNYPGLSINASETWNAGVALNNSIAKNGIAINDSENTDTHRPGISLNSSTATLCNFAINNSITNPTNSCSFQFAANNAHVTNYGFAINGSTNDHSVAIGTPLLASNLYSLAYDDSNASDYAISIFNSTGYDYSIALHKSIANYSAVSLYNSSANYESITLYDSSAVIGGVSAGHNIATHDSSAVQNSISTHNSYAYSGSVALFDSEAVYDSLAILNSTATTNDCVALMKSFTNNSAVAFNNSNAHLNSLAVNDCQRVEHYSIGLSNCVVTVPQHIALYTVTAADNANKAFDAYFTQFVAPVVRNISSYISDNISLYESTVGYSTDYFPANVFTGYSCGSTLNGSATSGKYHIEHTMTKYSSFNAGNDSISYYSSIVGVGVSATLAMYDSVIKTDAMILTPNGQDSIFTSLASGNIAMYNSTITSGDNTISLWNDKVKIKERGSVNDNVFIDMNIKSNVSKPDYSVLNGIDANNKDSQRYRGKHIFIIA